MNDEREFAAAAAPAPAVVRDVRIDRIGFASELQKQYVDDVKSAVKSDMLERETTLAEGDYFEARLVAGGTVGTIDPRKFHRLIDRGSLKLADFLACCRIDRGKAEELVAGKDLDRMSEFRPASPQLRVTRKKGVEIKLVDALKGLGAAIGG
jgi:hypothetical protein